MVTKLKESLWAYIMHCNPELMYELQEQYKVSAYLQEQVSKVLPFALRMHEQGMKGSQIIELCLKQMTEPLKPSRFLYITSILDEDFDEQYQWLKQEGLLTEEGINLVGCCSGIFEAYCFNTGNEDNPLIRAEVKGRIADYFFDRQKEKEDR